MLKWLHCFPDSCPGDPRQGMGEETSASASPLRPMALDTIGTGTRSPAWTVQRPREPSAPSTHAGTQGMVTFPKTVTSHMYGLYLTLLVKSQELIPNAMGVRFT